MDKAKLTTEKKLELIQKISALAGRVTLEYVRGLAEVVNDPEAEMSEMSNALATEAKEWLASLWRSCGRC